MTNVAKQREPIQASPYEDIFRMDFEGALPIQDGQYAVVANDLDENGQVAGGGIVANFAELSAAERCYTRILELNPAHKPELLEMDWDSYEGELIRSPQTDAAEETRRRTQRAFDEGRVIKRKRK